MTITLNSKQTSTLLALRTGERGAYPGLHLGTLQALERKGLVKAKRGLGSMAMPHTSIKWSLSPAGLEFVNHVAATGYP